MKEATARSPCHLTGMFQIFDQSPDPLRVGSRGAGVSICGGVETRVRVRKSTKNSFKIGINGSYTESAQVSEHLIDIYLSRFKIRNFEISVDHRIETQTGMGFGVSGAAALGLSLALNETFDLGASTIEAAQLAHIADVECKTGLGTVAAETFGGLEIRIKPGAPGIAEIKQISVPDDYVIACLTFRTLSTSKALSDEKVRRRVDELGGILVDKLIEEPEVTNFMRFSRRFAEHVGLISNRMRKVFDSTDSAGIVCSMPMFGESIFTLVEKESLDEVLTIFRKVGSDKRIIVSEIDFEGARLVSD